MDGQQYALAEYENQQNHQTKPNNIKTDIMQIFEPKEWRTLRGRPPFGASIREM